MLTAILPIRIDKNGFWSSSRGIDLIETFLKTCTHISDIDQFVVITKDDRVCRLAEQKGMKVSSTAIPGSIDQPFTYEQTHSLVRNFGNYCTHEADALIVADHRNLFLTADDISRFYKAYQQNPENKVISLAFCRDYPCQLKSFFTFLGCVIFRFNEFEIKKVISNSLQLYFTEETTHKTQNHAEIKITVSARGSRSCISFYCQERFLENFVVQILPFDKNGPLYMHCHELFVKSPKFETLLDVDIAKLTGVIFNFTTLPQSGEYDTIEFFTPENAPWELGWSGSNVVGKDTHEPMYGRQQFQSLYTYDGSLCVMGAKHISEHAIFEPTQLMINDSCIVTDWVDYWFSVV